MWKVIIWIVQKPFLLFSFLIIIPQNMSAKYSSIIQTTFSHSYLYQEVGCCVLTLPCVLSEISSTLHLLKVRMADFNGGWKSCSTFLMDLVATLFDWNKFKATFWWTIPVDKKPGTQKSVQLSNTYKGMILN